MEASPGPLGLHKEGDRPLRITQHMEEGDKERGWMDGEGAAKSSLGISRDIENLLTVFVAPDVWLCLLAVLSFSAIRHTS